jgi:hypothetical protein
MERVEEEERKWVEEEKRIHGEEERRYEEEQCKCKEEAEHQCKWEEFKWREAESIMRKAEEAKGVREAKAAKKVLWEEHCQWIAGRLEETEGDKGKKRTRSELEDDGGGMIMGEVVEKDGVMWTLEKGKVCDSCKKAHWRCLWRGGSGKRTMVCFTCHESKKACRVGKDSEKVEVGLLRKKRAPSRKGKEKAEPVASGSESGLGLADMMERLLLEIQ